MSNYLAIATVTAALQNILQGAAAVAVPGANVTIRRPDRANVDAQDQPSINIFLYQVQPNVALSNADLPTRSIGGTFYQRPQIALDLFYLLSFHGSDLTLEAQRLMGSAAITLHVQPWLTADVIRATLTNNDFLTQSDLIDQVERIKFGPMNLSLEELSKLWSVFFQIPYTLSIAYRASVVLIEAQELITPVKPVLERSIHVTPEVLPS